MTKEFKRAKAGTIRKWRKVATTIKVARQEGGGLCSFCERYDCKECPVRRLCNKELHTEIKILTNTLIEKVEEILLLLEDVEEA